MITALLIVSTMAVFLPVTSAQAKQDATLSLSASNTSVTANDNITLIGTLSVSRNGTVTLFWSYNCYCFNYGDSLIMTNGEFSTDFTAGSTGFYAFKVIWGGDSEYNSATSNIVTVSVSQAPVQTANVTFSITGITENVGPVLRIDNTNYTVAQLPKIFTWAVGSTHSYAWYSPVSSSTTQYAWSSASGLSTPQNGNLTVGSGGGNVTAIYQISSNPLSNITLLAILLIIVAVIIVAAFLIFRPRARKPRS